MMRKFYASDEYIKELRSDLAGIGQKVDTHAISIKRLGLRMAQLSATRTHENRALFLATLSKIEKMMRCMAITTRGGNQTIDPYMPSNEEKVIKDNNKVVEVSGEVEDNTGKYVEVPKKVTSMPRPPPIPQS